MANRGSARRTRCRVLAGAVLATFSMSQAAGQSSKKTEKVNGYAEFKKGDTLIVDGQRVVAGSGTKVTGPKLSGLGSIPLGYEVKLEGRRDTAGTLVAGKVDAKPNGSDGKEKEIIAASDQAE